MSKKKSTDVGGKVHPWRLCEVGSHWVREHTRTTPKGNVVTVKALIASESSFNPKAKTKSGGLSVRGLMQIRDDTRKIVGDIQGELKRGYISAQPDDLWDPSVNISIGIRWLFRKRQIIRAKNPNATWRDAVAAYKAFEPFSNGMENFDVAFSRLQECK